jgi:hypothetical protein
MMSKPNIKPINKKTEKLKIIVIRISKRELTIFDNVHFSESINYLQQY